jgi:hypothetical protein
MPSDIIPANRLDEIAGTIPHLHPFAITLLLVTPSFLNDIKDQDDKITTFLKDSGVTRDFQMYLDVIHLIVQDAGFKSVLPQIHKLLKTKLGQFYPTSPCPRQNDSIDIMSKLS